MTTAAQQFGAFVAALRTDAVEPTLLDKARDHLLDTIGVACAGLSEPAVLRTAEVVRGWGGAPRAGVIGSSLLLPAPKAAFLNALAARIHTFDDTHEAGPAHPGSAVVSAALAAAEQSGASGRTLLQAVLAGYEVATRVSRAFGAAHYNSGFHSTGTCTPFGAAAAAAHAFGLDAVATTAAIALAGEAAIGFRQYQQDGAMLDTALNGARGAESGVGAAEMAAAGLSGPPGILDGKWGVIKIMGGGDPASLAKDLGTHWEFRDTVLKPYSSCRFTHGPVDILRASGLDPATIERLEIATFRTSCDVSDRPDPQSEFDAILSHQLAAALALLRRPILPATYRALDRTARDLAARISVRHDPSLDAQYPARWPHRLTVSLKDGSTRTLVSDQPPAADRAAARTKFLALASPVLGEERAGAVAAMVAALETMPDTRGLARLLRPDLAEAA
jgi:2-methylcitrate dehydratase PrpD